MGREGRDGGEWEEEIYRGIGARGEIGDGGNMAEGR